MVLAQTRNGYYMYKSFNSNILTEISEYSFCTIPLVEIDYPAINNNVYNYGAVLVYMDVDGAWSQVPLTYYYEDVNQEGETINCAASIEVATLNDGGVRMFWTESDFYNGARPGTHNFKIVAIEASVYSHRSDVNYSDYNAVKTAFQLAD